MHKHILANFAPIIIFISLIIRLYLQSLIIIILFLGLRLLLVFICGWEQFASQFAGCCLRRGKFSCRWIYAASMEDDGDRSKRNLTENYSNISLRGVKGRMGGRAKGKMNPQAICTLKTTNYLLFLLHCSKSFESARTTTTTTTTKNYYPWTHV